MRGGNPHQISDALIEIRGLFAGYSREPATLAPSFLPAFERVFAVLGDAALEMEIENERLRFNLIAQRERDTNVVLFPVVRRETFGGAA